MKNVTKLFLLLTFACIVSLCIAAKPAQARDSYGYIIGLSDSTGNVSSITVYDNTTHVYEGNSRGVAWGGWYGAPQDLRWYANGLTPNHS